MPVFTLVCTIRRWFLKKLFQSSAESGKKPSRRVLPEDPSTCMPSHPGKPSRSVHPPPPAVRYPGIPLSPLLRPAGGRKQPPRQSPGKALPFQLHRGDRLVWQKTVLQITRTNLFSGISSMKNFNRRIRFAGHENCGFFRLQHTHR